MKGEMFAGLPVVWVPGWGYGPQLWTPLQAALQDAWGERPTRTLDLWGAETPALLPPRFIGVGHSFGVLWLLREHGAALAGLVSLSGFTRFPVPHRVRARMQTQFARTPEQVLADFHRRCRVGDAPTAAGTADRALHCGGTDLNERSLSRLTHGLDALGTWEAALPTCPVLALHGATDVIIHSHIAHAQFPGLIVCPDAPHALPLTHPAWCAARIREWLAT